MDDAIYSLEHLRKVYDGRTVVDIDHLDIYRGEILAIVGPSGAGKSTLLRLLNFLEPPSHGQLSYRGQIVQAGKVPLELRREVTTVFQHPVLLNTSVFGNIAYGLKLRATHVNGQADELLARVGLQSLARAPARKLSGGEKQRVALARALVIAPRVLLLDEPTANLDPYNGSLIEEIVQEQNRERGITMVLVTHNIFQARRLAHRVALMLDGRLIQVSTTQTFFDSPDDPRAAAFVRGELVF